MSTLRKLTMAEYDRLIQEGYFADSGERIELIRGELREMSPIGTDHDDIVQFLTRWSFQKGTSIPWQVRVQSSLGIPELDSVPQPDLAWLRDRNYRKVRPVPADVLLVVEVAESSLRFDLGEKAQLYAEAGIIDYWVIDIPHQQFVIHREPGPNGFRSVTKVSRLESIRPIAAAEFVLAVADVFPPE